MRFILLLYRLPAIVDHNTPSDSHQSLATNARTTLIAITYRMPTHNVRWFRRVPATLNAAPLRPTDSRARGSTVAAIGSGPIQSIRSGQYRDGWEHGMHLSADHPRGPFRHLTHAPPAVLGSKPRLIDEPRLFKFRSRCFLFAGRARCIPLWRFLVVEPLCF